MWRGKRSTALTCQHLIYCLRLCAPQSLIVATKLFRTPKAANTLHFGGTDTPVYASLDTQYTATLQLEGLFAYPDIIPDDHLSDSRRCTQTRMHASVQTSSCRTQSLFSVSLKSSIGKLWHSRATIRRTRRSTSEWSSSEVNAGRLMALPQPAPSAVHYDLATLLLAQHL